MSESKDLPQREAGATLSIEDQAQLIANREARRIEQEEDQG